MAGYEGYSKSNNALDAESEGKFPASVLAKKLGVQSQAIKALMRPCEWHHTSSHYNATNYYDGMILLDVKNGTFNESDYDEEDLAEARELLEKLQAWQPAGEEVHENCDVKWLEWSGTRKHPKAQEMTASGCRVAVKGSTCMITFADGKTMTKRQETRGFFFYPRNVEA